MESKQSERPLRVLFNGWAQIPHSYAIVNCFLLVHLHLNYGPNGKIKKNAIEIFVKEADYFNPAWNNKKKLVYTPEYNEILKNLRVYNEVEPVDLIYRQTYPYNILNHESTPKCVFYTSEFGKLTNQYFSGNTPENAVLQPNIFFTSPSIWSALGMKNYGLPDHRNRIITHGVDTSIFKRDITNRKQIREMYSVKDSEILLINIGAMTANKGIRIILETLNVLLKNGHSQYKLMLKGTGDLYQCNAFLQVYFNEFRESGKMTQNDIDVLMDHIIFTDKTISFSRVNDLFNACDAYFSPYMCEGFNLAPLESLASGLPVIVPRTGSTKEYMSEIYNNGGISFIHYIESVVGRDQEGNLQNVIQLQDVLTTISKINFKKEQNNKQMTDYINKNLSWDYVSTLLFDYFKYIVKNC